MTKLHLGISPPLCPGSANRISVDDQTDILIQRIIRQKFSKHTIIAVAHKLETIIDFDKVAVLQNGDLKEFGNPHQLLAQDGSMFKSLYTGIDR